MGVAAQIHDAQDAGACARLVDGHAPEGDCIRSGQGALEYVGTEDLLRGGRVVDEQKSLGRLCSRIEDTAGEVDVRRDRDVRGQSLAYRATSAVRPQIALAVGGCLQAPE